MDRLVVEDDSSTIIGWMRSYAKDGATHPLLQDIGFWLREATSLVIYHVYRETNFDVD